MFDIIIAELIKLKRSKIFWLIPIAIVLPVLMTIIFVGQQTNFPRYCGLFFSSALVYTSFTTPAIVAILTGYVFSREYIENTINTLFTYPTSRLFFYIAKLIIIMLIIIIVMIFFTLLTVILCFMLRYKMFPLGALSIFIESSILMILVYCALIPLSAIVGMVSKKSIVPSSIYAVSLILSLVFLLKAKLSAFLPGCIPSLIASKSTASLGGFLYFSGDINVAFITLLIVFAVSLLVGMIYYRNADVV